MSKRWDRERSEKKGDSASQDEPFRQEVCAAVR